MDVLLQSTSPIGRSASRPIRPASSMAKESILVIEDEDDIAELVHYNLERSGYRVQLARDGESGLKEAIARLPNLIVLDLMLPGIDGLEVCRRLRMDPRCREIPIIILTARTEETDVVLGLEMGADDYLAKPFSPRELIARIRAVLRRGRVAGAQEQPHKLERGGLELDAERHEVRVEGEVVPFTRAEFRLLWLLLAKPGRVFQRKELVDALTEGEGYILERNVDVHVSSIRRKLGPAGALIATVRGVGYKCRD
jgi:two-component system phosphate regulon response regulator PhoB